MTVIEIALFTTLVVYIGLLSIKKVRETTIVHYIPFLATSLMVNQMLFEIGRWQLYPIYFVTTMLTMNGLIRIYFSKTAKHQSYRLSGHRKLKILVVVALVCSGGAVYSFPVLELPEPSGPYKIGTSTFDFTDNNRMEAYDGKNTFKRKIKVQLWYPSLSVNEASKVFWLEDGVAVSRAIAKDMKTPHFLLDHTASILSNAYRDTDVLNSSEGLPVIVISHGWTGFRNIHSDLAELLASHGYIVFGIEHTYGSQVTVFKDGSVALLNPEALPNRDATPDFLVYANKLVTTYAGDVSFILDQLDDFNEGRYGMQFAGTIDLNRIGLLGHSTGGGADVLVALNDERIKAVLGMDAWVEPIAKEQLAIGLNIPTLFLRSEQWETGFNNEYLMKLLQNSSKVIGLYQINQSTHIDFTMAYMLSRLTRWVGITGTLEREDFALVLDHFILTFFDDAVKGEPEPGPIVHPEMNAYVKKIEY